MSEVNNRKIVETDSIIWVHVDKKTKEVHKVRANPPLSDKVLLNGTSMKCSICGRYVTFYPENVAVETAGTCRCGKPLFTSPWSSISPPVFCDNLRCSKFHIIVHPEDQHSSRGMKKRVKDMEYYLEYGHYPDEEDE